MNAQEASRIFSGCARFSSKATGECGEIDGEIFSVENFIAIDIRDRNFGGWDQIEAVGGFVKIVFEFRKIAGADETIAQHEIGRIDLFVSARERLMVGHEIEECAL